MSIIIFDNECLLCCNALAFIVKHDSKKNFYFLSLDSSRAKELMQKYDITQDSIVLIKGDSFYLYSQAILEILKGLDAPYKYLYILRFIPVYLRDGLYKLIAKYRLKLFKKKDTCLISHQERLL